MSRIARNQFETNFFHNMTQGINKEYIFEENRCKKKYLELLEDKSNKCNIKLISFTIMDNHAHILLYTENIQNMSLFMKKINSQNIFPKNADKILIMQKEFLDTWDDKEVFVKKLIKDYEKEHELLILKKQEDIRKLVQYIKENVNISYKRLSNILSISEVTLKKYMKK